MNRIPIFLAALSFWALPGLRAQDAATEERLNKLAGTIADVSDAQKASSAQVKAQLQSLSKEIENLREQMSKPVPTYASQEDLQRLADAVKEIDRKRMDDMERFRAEVRTELQKLAAILAQAPAPAFAQPPKPRPSPESEPAAKTSSESEKYVIKKDDNLARIVRAYRKRNIAVTQQKILDANPGLKPDELFFGKTILIPIPPAPAP